MTKISANSELYPENIVVASMKDSKYAMVEMVLQWLILRPKLV